MFHPRTISGRRNNLWRDKYISFLTIAIATIGYYPIMPVTARDREGTSRDKAGTSRDKVGTYRDQHGQTGTKRAKQGTHGQNRVWYISAGNELELWLLL